MKVKTIAVAGNPELQDRVEIIKDANRLVIALADGAGGMSGGTEAAEFIISQARENAPKLLTAADCEALLHNLDRRIADELGAGESTAVVLVIDGEKVFGASAGDSEAWLFSAGRRTHLTKGQFRKPLLGSGEILAVKFSQAVTDGVLMVASDGLWKYTSYEKVDAEIQKGDEDLLERLVNSVRLRSGALQDDVAIAALYPPF